ncbi:MAG: hypothetical protein ACREP9_19425 [Candidatus Dormibacteraceae bacterium]
MKLSRPRFSSNQAGAIVTTALVAMSLQIALGASSAYAAGMSDCKGFPGGAETCLTVNMNGPKVANFQIERRTTTQNLPGGGGPLTICGAEAQVVVSDQSGEELYGQDEAGPSGCVKQKDLVMTIYVEPAHGSFPKGSLACAHWYEAGPEDHPARIEKGYPPCVTI